MRIAFFVLWRFWETDFSMQLELMERELNAGNSITVYYCNGTANHCPNNPAMRSTTCMLCKLKLLKSVALLSHRVKLVPLESPVKIPRFDFSLFEPSYESLMNLTVNGFHPGIGVVSEIVSLSRNPEPDWSNMRSEVRKHLLDSIAIYERTVQILQTGRFDYAYVYNARIGALRAIFEAAQTAEIPIRVFDRGCDMHHVAIYENNLAHSIAYNLQWMRSLWADALKLDRSRAEQIGQGFYRKRRERVEENWWSFVKDQEPELLPADYSPDHFNVVLYTSSEDEFVAISDEWSHILGRNQLEILQQLIQKLSGMAIPENFRLYVRLHPNMKTQDARHTNQYLQLQAPFLTVISYDSKIDSYKLLDCASKVIVFNSTVGMEAAFYGKDVILADQAIYRTFAGLTNIGSYEELIQAIFSPVAPRCNRDGVLMFGYFYETFGDLMEHVVPSHFTDANFKGQPISDCAYLKKKMWKPDIVFGLLSCFLFKQSRSLASRLSAMIPAKRQLQ